MFHFRKETFLFRVKISGFAFSPASKHSLQVCVAHVPIPPATRKGQLPMILFCNCTGAMQSERQQTIRYVLLKIAGLFFCQSRRAFLDVA